MSFAKGGSSRGCAWKLTISSAHILWPEPKSHPVSSWVPSSMPLTVGAVWVSDMKKIALSLSPKIFIFTTPHLTRYSIPSPSKRMDARTPPAGPQRSHLRESWLFQVCMAGSSSDTASIQSLQQLVALLRYVGPSTSQTVGIHELCPAVQERRK